MAEHFFKNWIVYLMLAGFICFIVYAAINSRKPGNKDDDKDHDG